MSAHVSTHFAAFHATEFTAVCSAVDQAELTAEHYSIDATVIETDGTAF